MPFIYLKNAGSHLRSRCNVFRSSHLLFLECEVLCFKCSMVFSDPSICRGPWREWSNPLQPMQSLHVSVHAVHRGRSPLPVWLLQLRHRGWVWCENFTVWMFVCFFANELCADLILLILPGLFLQCHHITSSIWTTPVRGWTVMTDQSCHWAVMSFWQLSTIVRWDHWSKFTSF